MDSSDIEGRVKSVVKEVLKIKEADITAAARFKEDLGADSLDKVTLLMALEQEFNGSISDEEAQGMDTVGQATELITRLSFSAAAKG